MQLGVRARVVIVVTERYRLACAYDGIVRWCLSFHAAYGCRHSGACCRAGWSIPFNPAEAARVEALPLARVGGLVRSRNGDGTAFALTTRDGTCGFFEPTDRLCAIHRVGGSQALPTTCQMFPRVVLLDARGVFVSLSHFCPTAAALLFDETISTSIIEAPSTLVNSDVLEGLDARDTWAPLLRPGVLMDLESYGEWERQSIALLTAADTTPWRALGGVVRATEALVRWTPNDNESLRRRVDAVFAATEPREAAPPPGGALSAFVRNAVPEPLRPPMPPPDFTQHLPGALETMSEYRTAVNRWLAARLFGTWMAYQATGLRAIVRYLRASLDVLVLELARGASDGVLDRRAMLEAFRRSDHLIIHLATSQRIATLLS
jgi:Fe-S-cluster containining protein